MMRDKIGETIYPTKSLAAEDIYRTASASTAVREAMDVQWTVCPRAFRPLFLDQVREAIQELERELPVTE